MRARTDQALARSLGAVSAHVTRHLATALAGEACTLEEWWVLSCLAEQPGRPMSEIAAYAMLPGPSLTKLVDRMVDQNGVYRRGDVADRRRILLYPTVRGLERHAQLKAVVDSAEAELGDLVGPDVLAELRASLGTVLQRLR